MASERLVKQAKLSLVQHYRSRPQQRHQFRPSNGDRDDVWEREFAQLLADYDFTVGGSSKRDDQVKSWVDEVQYGTEQTLSEPAWPLQWASSLLRGTIIPNYSFGIASQDPALSSDPDALDEDRWEDMNRYMAVPNWDYLVDTIHKVERNTTGEIMVYFTSRHGEKIKERGVLCKARLPKKLLAFYEENLRWNDNVVVNGH